MRAQGSVLSLLLTVFLLGGFALAAYGQASVSMEGYHSWKIKGKKCTFGTTGAIVNNESGGYSGTLRLSLWVNATEFPSYGYRVATYELGQLDGGYQYSGYSLTTQLDMPKITGFFYLTIAVEQYTEYGWVTSDYIGTGIQYLKAGKIKKPRVWKAPAGKVKPPAPQITVGQTIQITLKGSVSHGYVVYVPPGSQLKLRIEVQDDGQTMVYGGSKPEGAPALYTYETATDTHVSTTVPVGRLFLDYGYFYGADAISDITLFFKSKARGFYKSFDTDQGFSGDSWGIFRIK